MGCQQCEIDPLIVFFIFRYVWKLFFSVIVDSWMKIVMKIDIFRR